MSSKPEPEIIGEYIHYRVRDPKLFISETFRTIDISVADKIKAVAGKLKNPPEGEAGSMVIQKYLFHIDKWTIIKATAWIKKHGKSTENTMNKKINLSENVKILGTKEAPFTKTFDISNLKISEENGQVVVRGYANTKNKADRYGDIPTVFSSLRNYVYELTEFKKNPVMLLDHYNKVSNIAGSFTEIEEDDIGLRIKAVFSNSDLPEVKHARTVYLEGHAKAFSIAGKWQYEDKDHKDHLTYAEIYHISPVGVGADPDALGFAEIEPKKEKTPEKPPAAIEAEKQEADRTKLESLKAVLVDISEAVGSDEAVKKLKEEIQALNKVLEKSQEES